MNRTKFLLLASMILSVLTIFAVYALPSITVNVQQAGEGQGQIAAPITAVSVNLLFDSQYTEVTAVEVVPAQNVDAGSIIVVHVLDSTGSIQGYGTYSASTTVTAGATITVPLNTPVLNASVDKVDALVIGPKY